MSGSPATAIGRLVPEKSTDSAGKACGDFCISRAYMRHKGPGGASDG